MGGLEERIQLLFLRQADALRGLILGLLGGDRVLADDVFQEVFLVVTRRAADFDQARDFGAWARGIARRQVLQLLRERRDHGLPLSPEVVERLADEAPDEADWSAHRAALAACVETLAPRARQITALHYHEDLTPPTIAVRLAWTLNAVQVALSRARAHLRDCVERHLRAPGGGA
jgi:RNA polymerase sigma-70 factor (ECF subfamily)